MVGQRLLFVSLLLAAEAGLLPVAAGGARAQERVLHLPGRAAAEIVRGAATLAHRPLFGFGARTFINDLPYPLVAQRPLLAPRPLAGTIGPRQVPGGFDPPRARVCFSSAESREKILSNRLTEPFAAMRRRRIQGDALRARLCRWDADEFVYEVSILRRDGRIVHIYMNAQNGEELRVLDTPALH